MHKLPKWAEDAGGLRPQQVVAIQDILEAFKDSQIVFYEAPTGTGKTLVAEAIRQELKARGLYLCSTISLQEQFQRDFEYAAILKGRSNYPTLNSPNLYRPENPSIGLSCADCTKRKVSRVWVCNWCEPIRGCPYEQAKATALASPLVCSNLYYFLYEANYVGSLHGRGLVVVDEADLLEQTLLAFVQVEITDRRVKEFGLPYPGKKTVMSSWIEWAEESWEIARKMIGNEQDALFPSDADLAKIKRRKRLENLVGDLARLLDPDFGLESDNWVYDGYREGHIQFKPIVVAPYVETYLWRHSPRWLLMSATIISPTEMAMSLGLA